MLKQILITFLSLSLAFGGMGLPRLSFAGGEASAPAIAGISGENGVWRIPTNIKPFMPESESAYFIRGRVIAVNNAAVIEHSVVVPVGEAIPLKIESNPARIDQQTRFIAATVGAEEGRVPQSFSASLNDHESYLNSFYEPRGGNGNGTSQAKHESRVISEEAGAETRGVRGTAEETATEAGRPRRAVDDIGIDDFTNQTARGRRIQDSAWVPAVEFPRVREGQRVPFHAYKTTDAFEADRARISGTRNAGMLQIDIVELSTWNTHGYEVGSAAIDLVGESVHDVLARRNQNISDPSLKLRFYKPGGDEYKVIVPGGISTPEELHAIQSEINAEVAKKTVNINAGTNKKPEMAKLWIRTGGAFLPAGATRLNESPGVILDRESGFAERALKKEHAHEFGSPVKRIHRNDDGSYVSDFAIDSPQTLAQKRFQHYFSRQNLARTGRRVAKKGAQNAALTLAGIALGKATEAALQGNLRHLKELPQTLISKEVVLPVTADITTSLLMELTLPRSDWQQLAATGRASRSAIWRSKLTTGAHIGVATAAYVIVEQIVSTPEFDAWWNAADDSPQEQVAWERFIDKIFSAEFAGQLGYEGSKVLAIMAGAFGTIYALKRSAQALRVGVWATRGAAVATGTAPEPVFSKAGFVCTVVLSTAMGFALNKLEGHLKNISDYYTHDDSLEAVPDIDRAIFELGLNRDNPGRYQERMAEFEKTLDKAANLYKFNFAQDIRDRSGSFETLERNAQEINQNRDSKMSLAKRRRQLIYFTMIDDFKKRQENASNTAFANRKRELMREVFVGKEIPQGTQLQDADLAALSQKLAYAHNYNFTEKEQKVLLQVLVERILDQNKTSIENDKFSEHMALLREFVDDGWREISLRETATEERPEFTDDLFASELLELTTRDGGKYYPRDDIILWDLKRNLNEVDDVHHEAEIAHRKNEELFPLENFQQAQKDLVALFQESSNSMDAEVLSIRNRLGQEQDWHHEDYHHRPAVMVVPNDHMLAALDTSENHTQFGRTHTLKLEEGLTLTSRPRNPFSNFFGMPILPTNGTQVEISNGVGEPQIVNLLFQNHNGSLDITPNPFPRFNRDSDLPPSQALARFSDRNRIRFYNSEGTLQQDELEVAFDNAGRPRVFIPDRITESGNPNLFASRYLQGRNDKDEEVLLAAVGDSPIIFTGTRCRRDHGTCYFPEANLEAMETEAQNIWRQRQERRDELDINSPLHLLAVIDNNIERAQQMGLTDVVERLVQKRIEMTVMYRSALTVVANSAERPEVFNHHFSQLQGEAAQALRAHKKQATTHTLTTDAIEMPRLHLFDPFRKDSSFESGSRYYLDDSPPNSNPDSSRPIVGQKRNSNNDQAQ